MLPSASKDVSVKFVDQCIYIINSKDRLNELKGGTKIQNILLLLKYQSRFTMFKVKIMLGTEV